MTSTTNVIAEYDGFDFGFSAIDETPVQQTQVASEPVVDTEGLDEIVQDALAPVHDALETITNKVANLENILEAGISQNFDIDGYKSLVEKDVKEKLKALEGLIMPLLVNLMKNPDKDTIKWPNRKPIIEKQIEKILAITRES